MDIQYEKEIPIARTNLCSVERGHVNLTWLENLEVSGGRIVKFGRIVDEQNNVTDQQIVLKLKLPGGRIEAKTYAELVPVVFKQILKSINKTKIKVWPSTPPEPAHEVAHKVKTYPIQRRRERRAAEMEQYGGGDEVYVDDDQPAVVRKKGPRQDAPKKIMAPPSNEIPESFCTTFRQAIERNQPHVGIEFLTQSLMPFNSIPNATLAKTLYEITVFGPKFDGTFYPDPQKAEMVTDYLGWACSRNADMRKRLTEMAMSRWANIEQVLVQVIGMIYRRPGDECSSSNESLSRITNSLQVVANGLCLILNLIEYQLKPFIDGPVGTEQLRDQPIVKALRDNDGGIREALKFIVRINAQAWINFGHFRVGDSTRLYAHEPRPSRANLQCCVKQVRRVLDAFGKLTSFVAWVYAIEEDLRMDTKQFASVIVDVLNNELNINQVDADPFAAEKEKMNKADLNRYWEKVKLEFTLALQEDEEYAEPLQIKVAEVLGLRKKYSSLFDAF